jgi:hypothetical protein
VPDTNNKQQNKTLKKNNKKKTDSMVLDDTDSELQQWLKELLEKAKNNEFPDVIINIDGEDKKYSPILNYFDFKKKYDLKPETLKVACRMKDCSFKNKKIKFGKSGNLGKYKL